MRLLRNLSLEQIWRQLPKQEDFSVLNACGVLLRWCLFVDIKQTQGISTQARRDRATSGATLLVPLLSRLAKQRKRPLC